MLEKAGLIAGELNAARSRGWSLGLMAEDWAPVDAARAAEMLEKGFETAQQGQGIYRDLDLRRISAAWAGLDLARAGEAAAEIQDPGLRSWAFRELAEMGTGTKYYQPGG